MSNEDPRLYRIVPIGSTNQGWAIERDGKLSRSGDRLEGIADRHIGGGEP